MPDAQNHPRYQSSKSYLHCNKNIVINDEGKSPKYTHKIRKHPRSSSTKAPLSYIASIDIIDEESSHEYMGRSTRSSKHSRKHSNVGGKSYLHRRKTVSNIGEENPKYARSKSQSYCKIVQEGNSDPPNVYHYPTLDSEIKKSSSSNYNRYQNIRSPHKP